MPGYLSMCLLKSSIKAFIGLAPEFVWYLSSVISCFQRLWANFGGNLTPASQAMLMYQLVWLEAV